MAGGAEVISPLAANEQADGTAVHALEIDELIAMFCAHIGAKAERNPNARLAQEVLLASLVLRC